MNEIKRVDKALYMAYVHIYAAHVDSSYSKDESDYIRDKFGAAVYQEALKLYKSYNLSDGDKFISDYIDILKVDDIKDLKRSLDILYHVDGVFCQYEMNFAEFMKKLLQYVDVA